MYKRCPKTKEKHVNRGFLDSFCFLFTLPQVTISESYKCEGYKPVLGALGIQTFWKGENFLVPSLPLNPLQINKTVLFY